MQKMFHFLSYHNAIPIALGILVLGGGVTFAATNPDAIYSEQQTIVSVDNTYIADKDLSAYTPQARITAVTEDSDYYYVDYTFTTIDVDDSVWKDVDKQVTMTVDKKTLGQYHDLGTYVTEQLKQNISHEVERLAEAQRIERRHVSQKAVATVYGGLIGKMLDETTETLPGYSPVVVAPAPQPEPGQLERQAAAAAAAGAASAASPPAQAGAPVIQVLGNNPAVLQIGVSYVDLGATITGPTDADRNLGIHYMVDGVPVTDISIDTGKAGEHTVTYTATNSVGEARVIRTVIVGNPADGQEVSDDTPAALPSDTSSTSPSVDASTAATSAPADTGTSPAISTDTSSTASASTTPATIADTPPVPPADTSTSTPSADTGASAATP